MKNAIIQFLGRRISDDSFDAKLARVACFVAGVLVFALSIWKLTRLELSEAQLFFGVLLSGCVPLLCIILGFLSAFASPTGKPTV
jgi:uncharacterized membrane protein YiaA